MVGMIANHTDIPVWGSRRRNSHARHSASRRAIASAWFHHSADTK